VGQQEIIENGDFATDTIWAKSDAALTIAGGVADWSGAQAGEAILSQTIPELRGKMIIITFTITRTAGTLTFKAGATAGSARSTAETFTERLLMVGGDDIAFVSDADFIGTLDNVTAYVDTDATAPETAGGDTAAESAEASTREYTKPTDIY
jgi:hypothetical protein